MSDASNGYYNTKDLTLAAFLYASGVIFIQVDWPNSKFPALYIFKTPSDEILSAWQRGDDNAHVRSTHEAIRILTEARYKAERERS